jgi:hypothetical protein
VAFRYNGIANINFLLKAGEKTNLKETYNSKEHEILVNFKRVVVGFSSGTDTIFRGIAFYDNQGTQLLSVGNI